MSGFTQLFADLTAPQAELLSSATTLLSALIVTLFAPLIFHLLAARGMRTFDSSVAALKAASNSAELQSSAIRRNIGDIAKKVDELEVLLSSLQESVATTQNTLLEGRPEEIAVEDEESPAPRNDREKVKEIWRGVRELAERAAANLAIKGQTRARYARMDRRAYRKFLEAVNEDGHLPGEMSAWRQAFTIYSGAVHGASISEIEVELITALAEKLERATVEHEAALQRARDEEIERKQRANGNIVSFPPAPEVLAA